MNLSVQIPTAAVNPDMVWKSNLSWQMSSEHLDTLISQLPVEVGVKELGKLRKKNMLTLFLIKGFILWIPDIAGVCCNGCATSSNCYQTLNNPRD